MKKNKNKIQVIVGSKKVAMQCRLVENTGSVLFNDKMLAIEMLSFRLIENKYVFQWIRHMQKCAEYSEWFLN